MVSIMDGLTPIVSVIDALSASLVFTTEVATDACKTRGCNNRSTVTGRIGTAPPVMVVSLNRFRTTPDGTSVKVNHLVAFGDRTPETAIYTLDITRLCSPSPHGGTVVYELYAVVSHLGDTLQQGHYVAYVLTQKRGSLGWLCYNDAVVSEVSAQEIGKVQAYLLFYRLRCCRSGEVVSILVQSEVDRLISEAKAAARNALEVEAAASTFPSKPSSNKKRCFGISAIFDAVNEEVLPSPSPNPNPDPKP